jgi:Fe-S cluster biogenesis protein NfuA
MIDRTKEEIEKEIIELILERIQPAVEADGGMIVYQGFENGIVSVSMQGACSGCPSSEMTLKHGIENMLKYFVPEVEEVIAI